MKIIPIENVPGLYHFWCPGCKTHHNFQTKEHKTPPHWEFNGDLSNPTVSPSIRVRYERTGGKWTKQCHLFMKNGQLQFLNDCTHSLAGKTVDMVDEE